MQPQDCFTALEITTRFTLIIAAAVALGGVVVGLYYELRYRKGFWWQRHFDRGLFK